MVVFGHKWLYSGKLVLFWENGCNMAKVGFFGKGGYILAKWLYSGKSCCIRAKVFVLRKKWLYSGKSGCIRKKLLYSGKVVVFRPKWFNSAKSCCIRAKVV